MSAALKDRVSADIKAAMKAGEKERLSALRLVSAAIKQYEVDHRAELDEAHALELLTRMCKQRRESITQYESAGREDLAARERAELDLITSYLPAQLSDAELDEHIAAAVAATGASGPSDMGRVMGALKSALKGRADMGEVSRRVKARLAG